MLGLQCQSHLLQPFLTPSVSYSVLEAGSPSTPAKIPLNDTVNQPLYLADGEKCDAGHPVVSYPLVGY